VCKKGVVTSYFPTFLFWIQFILFYFEVHVRSVHCSKDFMLVNVFI
jgi:hypothetical protein